jgi:two-component system sensor histidine kinase VicK
MASIFLFYFLRIYDQSRNEAIAAKLSSLESKDNILHVVAHDLRNALSGSFSIIPVFKESLEERNIEECSSYLDIIEKSTTSSLAIVNEILESATLFAETKDIVFIKESVSRILNETIQQYRPAAAKKKISITFFQCQPDCFFKINVSMINRIFGNLLSNAIKFTRNGGTIEIRVSMAAEKIIIRVKDDGIGIPQELLPKIFNKYTTAGRKGTNGESSTGLGMYIVQNLLALHKATIHVESQVNVGTTFMIEFPREV